MLFGNAGHNMSYEAAGSNAMVTGLHNSSQHQTVQQIYHGDFGGIMSESKTDAALYQNQGHHHMQSSQLMYSPHADLDGRLAAVHDVAATSSMRGDPTNLSSVSTHVLQPGARQRSRDMTIGYEQSANMQHLQLKQ